MTRARDPDTRFVFLTSATALLLTMAPYLAGAAMAGSRVFMWLGYDLDDSCVYLSWMRQAAEGAWRGLDLFTTSPQHGMVLNPLFLILGRAAGALGLPLLVTFHAARIVLGLALLLVSWHFIRMTIAGGNARRLAFLFVCFSSGLGWLPFWWNAAPIQTPIDKWQPEAITFLSLYLSPLFCFALVLQVAIVALLYRAMRTGLTRWAVAAGLCGSILGLVHSYDVITMAAIWIVYLSILTARRVARNARDTTTPAARRLAGAGQPWMHAVVAGLLTAPAVWYMYAEFRAERVFHERALVPTLAPAAWWIVAGYGGTLALAIAGAWTWFASSHSQAGTNPDDSGVAEAEPRAPSQARPDGEPAATIGGCAEGLILLVVWACVNVAVAYLPSAAFQRKLLQGAHIPIALLAGVGAAWLFGRTKLPAARFASYAFLITLALSLSNLRFMVRDVVNAEQDRVQTLLERPYLQPGEIEALGWIAAHSPAGSAIQPLPWVALVDERRIASYDITLASFTPGLIGRAVYCGHWGETPDFGAKLRILARFALPGTPDGTRRAILTAMRVRYLVFSQKSRSDRSADTLAPMFRGLASLPAYLVLVHTNADADVYAVNL